MRNYPETKAGVDPDLLTRTSWVDAQTAYVQLAKGRIDGNRRALWVRSQLQNRLFDAGCFIQKHAGKVLFLGVLLLSLCCVGLKTVSIETDVEKLWVEDGGRLSRELAYTMKSLGEGFGTSYELVIQTPKRSKSNVLTVSSLLQHYEMLRRLTTLSVNVEDLPTFSFREICHAMSFPNLDENIPAVAQILEKLQACIIITPLDCFWEGSKLLGPDNDVYIPYNSYYRWTNLNPRNVVNSFALGVMSTEEINHLLDQAGIEDAYQSKPCLNPYDPECPDSAPNFKSKQPPDVGAALTGGCNGVSTKYMHWEEDLIVGDTYRGKTGQLMSAGALQSVLQLMGEKGLYDFYRNTYKTYGKDWTIDKAKQVLDEWKRQFTKTMREAQNATGPDSVYAMSSLDLADVMTDFSQISQLRVIIACLVMCIYAALSLVKLSSTVQSQSTIGLVGVMLVILSVSGGLGVCSVIGIKFNAATTQILPFLALGLGVDDVFLMAYTFSQIAEKPSIAYSEHVGEGLKRIGVSISVTSLCNCCAFFLASIIPIPAMRAFCLQCAILVVFNLATVLFIYPAVISIDLMRRRTSRMDFFCCFKWATLPVEPSLPMLGQTSETQFGRTPASSSRPRLHPGAVSPRDTVTRIQIDGQRPVTSLAPLDISAARSLHGPGPIDSPVRLSSSSSSQYLAASLPELSSCRCCSCDECKTKLSRWTLTSFAHSCYSPLLQNSVFKVIVVCLFVILLVASVIGIIRVRDGLDFTDIVPRDTSEHQFLDAQSKYFGFYSFYAVTQSDFDYTRPENQKLLYSYHQAYRKIDNIIKKEDGSLPNFWLQDFRAWLLDIQKAFDADVAAGHIRRDNCTKAATSAGCLGYKLMLQTGEADVAIDKNRFEGGRLVSNGIIYPPAFYNYLSAWTGNDALAYGVSGASLKPTPKQWIHDKHELIAMKIDKSQPLTYAQLVFYLHKLGDTDSITSTMKEIRNICEVYASKGLPNYPYGIIFTFWEQYIHLRFYMAVALGAALTAIFVVLSVTLLNPLTAVIVVVVIGMIVVELFGLMGLIGIKLSAIPAAILVITVGVSIEFTVHVCITFLTSIGSSRNARVSMTIESVFAPVTHGAISTLLGIVMLLGSQFDFIVRYFFVILTLLVALGLLNGLLLLPVMLSIIGPRSEVRPLDNGDQIPLPSPKPVVKKERTRQRHVRRARRLAYHARADPENALSTIAEESSQQHSSCAAESSSVSIDIHPEVVVETSSPQPPYAGASASVNGATAGGCCASCSMARMHSVPTTKLSSSTTTTTGSSSSGHHVTTIRTTARVKVEVHTPVPIISHSSPDFKSKKRKRQRMEDIRVIESLDSSNES